MTYQGAGRDFHADASADVIDTLIDMGDRSSTLSRANIATTLATALDALRSTDADMAYRVCGTSAAVLQGVPLPAGDIDILLAGRNDVDTFAAALSSFPCLYATSWLPESSQYFTRFEVNGVELELSTVERQTDSDALECVGIGPWRHYVLISCGSHRVPVVGLELRLATELLRDRADRYDPLLAHLGRHGFDAELLRRAMDACRVPPPRRRLVQDLLA
ncbi:MAG: hypothetical protein HOW59_28565 [Nonomuraea sp.]|nr:hypothetical protein [Nonomuraea sp.]